MIQIRQGTHSGRVTTCEHCLTGLSQAVIRQPTAWETDGILDTTGSGPPLCHYAIISDSWSGENHFVHTIYQAVFDGRSIGLMLKTMLALYATPTVAAPVRYSGFVSHTSQIDEAATAEYCTAALLVPRESYA